jgi:nucleotide-binding universal stress UspA family protein
VMRPTIVCGVDRSPNARAAARLATGLARRLGLGVELIHVVDPKSAAISHGGGAAVRSVTEEYLDLCVSVHVKSGFAPHVLAKAGRRATLLVIGSRGEGALRQTLLGGVAAELTREPLVPVIVVPPGVADTDLLLDGQTIVCGVRDEQDAASAHVAGQFAQNLGLTLTLAHVLGRSPIRISAEAPAPSILRSAADEFETATSALHAIARSVTINLPVRVDVAVLDGHPGPQLDRAAAARQAAMLAVGACDQAPVAGALAGSPPRYLMRHATRPVLLCPRPRPLTAIRTRTGGQIASLPL